MKNKRWLAAGMGIAISAFFLWLAFRDLKPEAVWASIQEANVVWVLVGAVTYFLAVAVITLRWRFLLHANHPIPLSQLMPLVCIGYAGNNIYPFRSGEILRIALLHREQRVRLGQATTTVIVERVFDGIVMLSFVLIALLLLDITSPEVQTVITFATPLFVGALVVFLVLAARPQILRRLLTLVAGLLPDALSERLTSLGEDIISGLSGLRTPAELAGAVVSSYLTWAIEAGVYWIVSFAFNLDTGYVVLLLVVGVVNLAGLIPASPGMFGVFETAVRVVLVAVGVDETLALAYGLVVHMVIWLPVTLVGLLFLLQRGLGLDALTRARQIEQLEAQQTG